VKDYESKFDKQIEKENKKTRKVVKDKEREIYKLKTEVNSLKLKESNVLNV
jgi:hypothetical protein